MNKSQAVALFMSLSLATGVTACAGQPQQTGGGEEGGNPAMTSPQPQKTGGGEEGASLAPTSPFAANWHQPAPRQSLDATLYLAGRGERGGRGGRGERGALPSSPIV
jgi:hypothetical protein